MPREIKIPVPDGLETHESVIHEVILREPRFQDYLDIGEIISVIRMPDGQTTEAEMTSNINAYIEKCLVQPRDSMSLQPAGIWLAAAVKGAVFDFFRDANSRAVTSRMLPKT